jgi:hypothetical protein
VAGPVFKNTRLPQAKQAEVRSMAGNTSKPLPGRRSWEASEAAIRGVVRAVYRDAAKAGSKPPNLDEIIVLVKERLAGYRASRERIRTIAREPEFASLRWKRGQTAAPRPT